MLYAEDLPVGREFTLGHYPVGEPELLAFARRYDPLPIHADPAAAESGPFGGLIASGLHTLAIYQRLIVDAVWSDVAVIAGRGMRDVRWLRPVRAGDTITGRSRVTGIAPRPDRGDAVLEVSTELVDQQQRPVLSLVLDCLVAARPR